MKYAPYSYSRISVHEQCPRKFKYSYILKLPEENVDKTALFKGSALHNSLENYPGKGSHKLCEKYQPIIDDFLKTKYKKYLDMPHISEEAIGLDENLNPCQYSKKAMFRGKVDYFTVTDKKTILIADWKSGKYRDEKYQSYDQLMFYAIYFFKKYSKVNTIIIKYIYIEHNLDNSMKLERKYLDNYCNSLNKSINSAESSNFEKKSSKLCDWCSYKNYCDNDN